MTEDEAQVWVRERVTAERFNQLETFAGMVIAENVRQNLIAPGTIPEIWARHIVDSLQLQAFASGERWLDIGSGGGFPGMVLAIAGCRPMMLVEPRRKRAEFLQACVDALGLDHIHVATRKVEQVEWPADVITARAVASVEKLLLAAGHCATTHTRWLLPRGSGDAADVSALLTRQRRVFHVEHSVTHPDSMILVLEGTGR